ncbi:hypothetical protein JYP46_11710 [Nitratireductor aquimarinus]|uniref:hypothetical protein n=1 Tax=Alphaproteobacteria TaxID=28211 RepID=UPI000DE1A24A|nr:MULTISPECIES: hypothetical protein [Alphaproteobacteria]MBN7757485.1 hypothetical protein [Nitratireductor aquimarinus]MBY6000245.1 hypothetical protein [Tritonibacter mobilis]MBY6022274.1 hypothetical protein [Nitratireductor sp. DP7N14-4]
MSENAQSNRRDRLEALLPFFLNGTLSGAELREVEEWLASDPEALASLAEAEGEYSATLADNEAIHPPADALARFSAALAEEAGPDRAAGLTLRERFARFLPSLPVQAAWVAAGLALAILVGQTVWLNLSQNEQFSVAGADREAAPFVFVTFRADASMAEVSALLDESGVEIAAGPLPGGLYRVLVPAETAAQYDGIAAALAEASVVETVVTGRRPADE